MVQRNQSENASGIDLPRRQVHLDFHTSEHLTDIGAAFREDEFQAAIKLGRVNSITLFAKCHHSWSYYPTTVGRPHPSLTTDLLGRQIEACHAIGVRCPIYYPVGWSANDASDHPEWCGRAKDGSILTCNADLTASPEDERPIVSWIHLCPASPGYRELILAQTEEICRRFRVDGFFYDICFNTPTCYCAACRATMSRESINIDDAAQVRAFTSRKWLAFMRDCNAMLHGHHPKATVFYNGMAAPHNPPAALQHQTHLELEDLPTTWGGYDKFPLRARFFTNARKPLVAMSGKFHTTWGEFGGFKSPDAMRFEVASMMAFGAACSFGDQLHPLGRMDPTTYRNIGLAYEYAERIEAYAIDSHPYSSLAIWPSHRFAEGQTPAESSMADDQGVANMLMEGQYNFEVIADAQATDLGRFKTIVLTGSRCIDRAAAARLRRYVEGGGSLLMLNESVLEGETDRLAFDIGAEYLGPARFKIDYTAAMSPLATDRMTSPFLNYASALRIAATDGRMLAQIHEPYFDRTYGQYCSHQNTPHRPEPAEHAAAVQKGNIVYLAHPLGRMYAEYGAWLHREIFLRALHLIHPHPSVRSSMPSGGRVSLHHQAQHHRYVLHLLYAPPVQRGRCAVIEDQVPLLDVTVTLNLPEADRRIGFPLRNATAAQPTLGPSGLTFRVPCVASHEVVVIEY